MGGGARGSGLIEALIFVLQDMPVCHVLNAMHIEKNISECVLKFLFGEKDSVESRRDLEEVGLR